jgi:hypothetical protein
MGGNTITFRTEIAFDPIKIPCDSRSNDAAMMRKKKNNIEQHSNISRTRLVKFKLSHH